MIKKSLKWLGWIVVTIVAIVAIFLIYVTVVDYKPTAQIQLQTDNNNGSGLKQGEAFTVTTFNIGYAGLDQGQDFFMDGGTMSRSSSRQQTEENLLSIGAILKETQSNMYLLQEVDKNASRSNHINEVEELGNLLPEYSRTFALNYKVPWVPVPVLHPMGSVVSGLLTLSKFQSTSNTRFGLPGKESWPVQQMELDRAFIASRFPVDNGKELVLINLHLSAFDKGGVIRKQQLDFLSNYIRKEIGKGSYLVIGGDWNHSLPGTEPKNFASQQAWPEWLQSFPETFSADGFQWANDPTTPSVRTLDIAYQKGVNFLAVIDGFLVSPNIEIVSVKGHDLSFKNSDHNPVTGSFRLK
ncbi:endonuclease/exonuclease/phosphatase family protein [Paenibacillus macquariensis]|uniref:Metal-dependent hydrolase, endonuclease/exonuclease/phosphatase family n=1 Tax=Paenibacillus macquariensis TaxID=948756 RepID=A0ABY1K3Y9_9BACL|nr:endonuclease/exonuclease/phosphatase family protein [Paenibacillus macquariensis]MEC0088911.1 endonuclease/exonuclease/phosphatase family protein [Paenibacillus macquariensis]OAB31943.1 endonuclease [Paenibacillus macquariensis subsp. macquariensis]SIR22567.1 Metal-dependent hydrolase, endonuclease/exonuclease/phosphatase family [Paenibacillus macquariensis]